MLYRLLLNASSKINSRYRLQFARLAVRIFYQWHKLLPFNFSLPTYPANIIGLTFSNPVGLAAGFERDGSLLSSYPCAGFGYVEIGTINVDASHPTSDEILTIIQQMNHVTALHSNKKRVEHQLWGVSLGSLRELLDEKTVADYNKGMELFWSTADYIVINMSRPDSPVRNKNIDNERLSSFLAALKAHHVELSDRSNRHVPMVAKLAVDYKQTDHILPLLCLLQKQRFDGVILAFEHWFDSQQVESHLRQITQVVDDFPLIVVGGIRSIDNIRQILTAGASLVQIYSGLIEQGPISIRKMISKL